MSRAGRDEADWNKNYSNLNNCDIIKQSVGAEIDRELAKERVGSRLE